MRFRDVFLEAAQRDGVEYAIANFDVEFEIPHASFVEVEASGDRGFAIDEDCFVVHERAVPLIKLDSVAQEFVEQTLGRALHQWDIAGNR